MTSNNLTSNNIPNDIDTYPKFHFIKSLQNKNNETIKCSPNTFEYLPLLLNQLQRIYNKTKYNNGTLITSKYIDNHIIKNHEHIQKQFTVNNFLRFKSYNGVLYLSNPDSFRVGYRISWWAYYFARLFDKYGSLIPNTDFVIFMGDTGNTQFDYTQFPFFVGDGVEIPKINTMNETFNQLPLFTMPRSFIWLHQTPVEGYADIMCFRDSEQYKFINKKDAAIFRGSATGGTWRTSKRGSIIIPANDRNISYINAKFKCTARKNNQRIPLKYCDDYLETVEQMKYKYFILIDGNSVRDAYPKQLGSGSIMLKQKSMFREFWYYSVKHDKHVIEFTDFDDLNDNIMPLLLNYTKYTLKKQEDIALNGKDFVENYLIDKCMDCFIVHMFQIYNYYFFNETEVELAPGDIKIDKGNIKKLLNEGYRGHIYDFEYNCSPTGNTIISQRLE